jgi:hypothetical protein
MRVSLEKLPRERVIRLVGSERPALLVGTFRETAVDAM